MRTVLLMLGRGLDSNARQAGSAPALIMAVMALLAIGAWLGLGQLTENLRAVHQKELRGQILDLRRRLTDSIDCRALVDELPVSPFSSVLSSSGNASRYIEITGVGDAGVLIKRATGSPGAADSQPQTCYPLNGPSKICLRAIYSSTTAGRFIIEALPVRTGTKRPREVPGSWRRYQWVDLYATSSKAGAAAPPVSAAELTPMKKCGL